MKFSSAMSLALVAAIASAASLPETNPNMNILQARAGTCGDDGICYRSSTPADGPCSEGTTAACLQKKDGSLDCVCVTPCTKDEVAKCVKHACSVQKPVCEKRPSNAFACRLALLHCPDGVKMETSKYCNSTVFAKFDTKIKLFPACKNLVGYENGVCKLKKGVYDNCQKTIKGFSSALAFGGRK